MRYLSNLAVISEDEQYRYELRRRWADGHEAHFVMLNPSTADAQEDDPTIRRCVGFASSWGFGALVVTNLFAFRATNPRELFEQEDPTGPENDSHVRNAAETAAITVLAWGSHGDFLNRDSEVLKLLAGVPTFALHVTRNGSPGHPLYLSKASDLKVFPQ
jgi:hypothetical protein